MVRLLIYLFVFSTSIASVYSQQKGRIKVVKKDSIPSYNDYYTLEIFSTQSKLYKEYYLLKKFPNTKESYIDGLYLYDVGKYRSLKQAKETARKINKQGYATKLVYIVDKKRSYLTD